MKKVIVPIAVSLAVFVTGFIVVMKSPGLQNLLKKIHL